MAIDQEQLLQSIYDTLFSAYTSPPAGANGQGGSDADKSYLILNWPGMQIDEAQFANPWSPNNPQGSTAATEEFSFFVDKLPALNPILSLNGQSLSSIYELIVNAQVVPPPIDPVAQKAYDDAYSFLHADGTDYDDNGKPITIKVDSPIYTAYKRKKRDYQNAVAALMANYFQYDLAKPEDQRKWSLLGPPLIDNVNTAWNDWAGSNMKPVEDRLATLAQSATNQVGKVFASAQSQFTTLRRASLTNPGKVYWPSYASPSNWYSRGAAEGWTTVTISSESLRRSEHSDYTSMSTGGKASWGLWSVGGSFSKQESHQSMSEQTSDLSISFKFARVEITRPWLNFLLLNLHSWNLGQAFGPGGLSNGTKAQGPGMPFPLLPQAFVAVRDLQITATWGDTDSSFVSKSVQGKASCGYGPFAVSGSYASSSTDKKFAADFDGRTITNKGLQIIGWISSLVPYAPPKPM
jgi:hypothetical protein